MSDLRIRRRLSTRFVRRIALVAVASQCSLAAVFPASSQASTIRVVAVGNAFAGTVSFLGDGVTYTNLATFNAVPDLAARKAQLFANSITYQIYQTIKQQKGGENYVDDIALSPDGTILYVSRGILEDVAAFNLQTGAMLWRTDIGGYESDHMAISPDGTQLVVSDLTEGVEKVFNSKTGQVVASFPAGTFPHEVDYSPNGARLYVGSLGITLLPYSQNASKGNRQLTIADAHTFQVLKTYQFTYGLRPDFITPDEKYYYFQQSYNRGFAEFNLTTGQISRTMSLPSTPAGDALFPDNLPNNSMHHGLALSGDGSTICNAGTIDNYVALVNRSTFTVKRIIPGFAKPYWAITSSDGSNCLVSNSDGNYVAAINYATGLVVAKTAVGWFPQRERLGSLDLIALAHMWAQSLLSG